jgi:hypothetical protein
MKKVSHAKNLEAAVEAINSRLELDMGVAVNVETIIENGLLGGMEPVGLRLWYRPIPDTEPVKIIAEAIVSKWCLLGDDHDAAVADVARALLRERQLAATAKG